MRIAATADDEGIKLFGPGTFCCGPLYKFRPGDYVEMFGSMGRLTGTVVAFDNNNRFSEYRYFVDWGPCGTWWVSEDQIEHLAREGG